MKKVSIIIPVHNGEKYIKRCLDSIVAQNFNDYEVIVVNDGSTDSTKDIVNEYVNNYSYIKQYINNNHGVSFSRNYGVALSNSEYVVFVDSDDIVKPNYLSILIDNVDKGYDLVCSGYNVAHTTKESHESKVSDNICYSKENISFFFDDLFLLGLINPVWNKIFRLSIIKKNNIKFREDLSVGEDLIFILDYLSFSKMNISVISDVIYTYNNPNFFSGKRYGNDYHERNLLNDYILSFYKKNNLNDCKIYNQAVINMYVFLLYDGCTPQNIDIIKHENKYAEVLLNFNKLSMKYKIFLLCIKHNFIIPLRFFLNLKISGGK